MLQGDARPADAHGTEFEPAHIEDIEGDDVPFADVAKHVLERHFAVVQDQRAGGRSANPHLVLFCPNREAGEVFLDQEGREFLAVNFGEDGEEICEPGIRNPHLFAVQNVELAIAGKLRAGAAIEGVRT